MPQRGGVARVRNAAPGALRRGGAAALQQRSEPLLAACRQARLNMQGVGACVQRTGRGALTRRRRSRGSSRHATLHLAFTRAISGRLQRSHAAAKWGCAHPPRCAIDIRRGGVAALQQLDEPLLIIGLFQAGARR